MRINLRGVKIEEEWYKRTRRGKPPMTFTSYIDHDTRKIKRIVVKKDPILKKYPKYERAIMQHEMVEAKLRSKRYSKRNAHYFAEQLEPKIIRGMNLKQLWTKLK